MSRSASAHRYQWTRADGSVGKGWRAKWSIDGTPYSKRGFTRKGDAEAYARDREAEARHGVVLDDSGSSITVAAWCRSWLAGLDIREETQASYDFALSRILPAFGNRPLTSLRQSEIRAWRRGLHKQDGSKLADSTGDKVQAVFGTILRAAVQDELLDRSPMPSGKRGQQRVRVVDPAELLTQAQVMAWSEAMPPWLTAAPILAATTGLRQSEMLGLRLPNVDFLRRQVHVVEQLRTRRGPGMPEWGPPKTAAGVRTVPLPKVAADALAVHLERYPVVPSSAGSDEQGPGRMEPTKTRPGQLDEPIFRTQTGLRWRQSGFQAQAIRARRAAGLPDWAHWHSLRDVAVSNWIRGGVDLRAVMEMAGHTDPKMTLMTYARLLPDSIDNARAVSDQQWQIGAQGHHRATGDVNAGSRRSDGAR